MVAINMYLFIIIVFAYKIIYMCVSVCVRARVRVRMKELGRGIGPWAMIEDAKEPEDNQVLIRTRGLRGQGQGPITTNR